MRILEESKIFTYVAWTVVIGFAGLVVMLAIRLKGVAEVLAISAAGGI